MQYKVFLFLILFLPISGFAQIIVTGLVQDSSKVALTGANIIALPQNEDQKMEFSITNNDGNYRLTLDRERTYVLEISYLGYQKITDTIFATENFSKNFVMQASNESLKEVTLESKMAVKVREDTITYRTKIFKTGEERKLREILKKLPGVEVDREGNVTVNGKNVNKLMVDGKTFFTGDTKLAIENIPADAVNEVEVLDNYSEVPFLKGLEDSDKMAMNIKLSEGKKKFTFGDLEGGGGIKDRYILHPTLFYYSPKTSVNLIGDFNNIGNRSFSLDDYINFEGGILSLMEKPGGLNIYNDDFAQFLRNEDFTFSKSEFGAFNIVQKINTSLDLNAYSIVSAVKEKYRKNNQITYLNEAEALDEFRTTTNAHDLFFSLNKLQLRYLPNPDIDLSYDAYLKTSAGNSIENIISRSIPDTSFINSEATPENLDFTQNIRFSKQFSFRHTSNLNFTYKHTRNTNQKDWMLNEEIFSGIIPFVEEENINLQQSTGSRLSRVNFDLKHYWVLNNTNHIYPRIGMNLSNQSFQSNDSQKLENGETNDFQEAGFNNKTQLKLVNTFIGLEYKKRIGDLILKPGIYYHYFLWRLTQFDTALTSKRKPLLLPQFESTYEINNSEKLKLKYSLKANFTDVSSFANRFRLLSFNSLYRGEESIENTLYHDVALTYYKFSLFKGLFLNASINYSKRERTIRNRTVLQGIDQINQAFYNTLPEENLNLSASFSKKIIDFKFTLLGNASFSSYTRIINSTLIDYSSKNYSYTFKTETSFDNLPNLEVGLENRFSDFESDNFENRFTQLNPYVNLQYDFLNNFIFKADYSYNYYENRSNNLINRFEIGDASLFYNKEDSPWGFELAANNIFNVLFKNSNNLNEFTIMDEQIFIQPRTLLFKLSYKL